MSNKEIVLKDYPRWIVYYAIVANAVGMMSMDIHLPVLQKITDEFNTSYFTSQLILILFYVVGVIARVTLGPMSDAYGRRKIFLLAVDIQIVGQAMQAFAFNIELLLLGRIIQALASGGLTILISAIISDVYVGNARTKMLSVNEFIQPLSFVVAPIIGGLLATHFGWRSGFIFLLINLIIARIIMGVSLIETNFQLRPPTFINAIDDYKLILRNKKFMCYSLIMAFIVSAYMLYAVISSYIYMNMFGMPATQFMIFQAIPLVCQSIIAFFYTQLNFKLQNMIHLGVLCVLASGISSVFAILGFLPFEPVVVLFNVMLICFGLGFVFPACMKLALDLFPRTKGTASSAIVVNRGIFAGIAMSITGYLRDQESILFYGVLICAICTVLCWFYLRKLKH